LSWSIQVRLVLTNMTTQRHDPAAAAAAAAGPQVLNLARFISVTKTRPLTWRLDHPYLIADR
jgi:hypothetical protein